MAAFPAPKLRSVIAAVIVPWLAGAAGAGAPPVDVLGPSSVLLLYDAQSADGFAVAQHYAAVRPGVNLLAMDLSGITSIGEQITAQEYLSEIRPQVLGALNDGIDIIVTTRGMPLRIDAGANGGSNWERYSSLESELARIESISTVAQMGDQDIFNPSGFAFNPYYSSNTNFDHENVIFGDIRLTARLDGFSAQDAINAIDRAQNVVISPTRNPVVLDDDPTAPATGGDRITLLKDNILTPLGQAFDYDNTNQAIVSNPDPIAGYVSHGVNDGAGGLDPGYIANQFVFDLAPGAVFHTHESFNAASFEAGGNVGGQGLIAEWLAVGGTAGLGHVEEPQSGTFNVANEDKFYERLLQGFTFVEAAWASIAQLSFVNTVVGDPLMKWLIAELLLGDANNDLTVTADDLLAVQQNFGNLGPANGLLIGDANDDGAVTADDLITVQQNVGSVFSPPLPLPEPAAAVMLATVWLLAGRRR